VASLMVGTVRAQALVSTSLEPVAAVAAPLRRRVRAVLAGRGLQPDAVDDALLVVEELVANVVDHARTRFALVVRMTGNVLRIEVRDGDPGTPHIQPVDPHAARGRGLQVVDSLSQRWGCEQHCDGKTVWAELPV
jgi:anti-sigma regulatory factor (Ser/Thr protein kinase)